MSVKGIEAFPEQHGDSEARDLRLKAPDVHRDVEWTNDDRAIHYERRCFVAEMISKLAFLPMATGSVNAYG